MRAYLMVLLFAIACVAQKKVDYVIPHGMSPEAVPYFLERFNKGKALYAQACADCHNKKVKGKSVVPDFSTGSLESYAEHLRNSNEQHAQTIDPRQLSSEDLSRVLYYLSHKKKTSN